MATINLEFVINRTNEVLHLLYFYRKIYVFFLKWKEILKEKRKVGFLSNKYCDTHMLNGQFKHIEK